MPDFPKLLISTRASVLKSGQVLTVRRPDNSDYDPTSSGGFTGAADTTFTSTCIVLPLSRKSESNFDEKTLEGLVRSSARYVLAVPNNGDGTERIQPKDILEYEGLDWIVAGTNILTFQGTDILYKLAIKRA